MATRLAVSEYYIGQGYKVSKVIKYAGVASSSWYYYKSRASSCDNRLNNRGRPCPGYSINPNGTMVPDNLIVAAIKKYRDISNYPHFGNSAGCHKLKYYLRRDYGYYVNHKKIYRLCKDHDLLLFVRRKIKNRRRKISINREIYKPNQLWEFDIKYGYVDGENRFFFLLAYLDVYSRKIVNYYVGSTCNHNLSATLDFALQDAGITGDDLVLRSDNGPQMTSIGFKKHLDELSKTMQHEFIPCATPNKNAHIESFFATVQREFIEVNYFASLNDVAVKLKSFIDFYNNGRVHGSLKYKTPNEVIDDYHLNGYNPEIKNLRI